jgi:hypothetical protein
MKTGTALTNLDNDSVLAFLNSGRTIFPYPGVKNAPMLNASGGVFQGQKLPASDGGGVYTSFVDFTHRDYLARGSVDASAPGNALLRTYLKNLTGKDYPAAQAFTDGLMDDIDTFQGVVGTHAAIVAAQALHVGLS